MNNAIENSPVLKTMQKNKIKQFIKEQCGDPVTGICDVSDLHSQEVEQLKKTNEIMGKYSAIFDPESILSSESLNPLARLLIRGHHTNFRLKSIFT